MRFLVDAQLPPALAKWLAGHGHEAWHVADIGLRDADDTAIWDHALQHGMAIVTKDEDFPHRRRQNPANSPVIVWLRIGNSSRRALLHWIEPMLPRIVHLIQQGDTFIEIR